MFFLFLCYLFVGIAIISDKFMSAIEVRRVTQASCAFVTGVTGFPEARGFGLGGAVVFIIIMFFFVCSSH